MTREVTMAISIKKLERLLILAQTASDDLDYEIRNRYSGKINLTPTEDRRMKTELEIVNELNTAIENLLINNGSITTNKSIDDVFGFAEFKLVMKNRRKHES